MSPTAGALIHAERTSPDANAFGGTPMIVGLPVTNSHRTDVPTNARNCSESRPYARMSFCDEETPRRSVGTIVAMSRMRLRASDTSCSARWKRDWRTSTIVSIKPMIEMSTTVIMSSTSVKPRRAVAALRERSVIGATGKNCLVNQLADGLARCPGQRVGEQQRVVAIVRDVVLLGHTARRHSDRRVEREGAAAGSGDALHAGLGVDRREVVLARLAERPCDRGARADDGEQADGDDYRRDQELHQRYAR